MAWLRTLGLGAVLVIGWAAAPAGGGSRTMRSAQGSIAHPAVALGRPVAAAVPRGGRTARIHPGPEGVALGGWHLSDARVVAVPSWIRSAPGGASPPRAPAGRDSAVAADGIVQATPSPAAPTASPSPPATATVGAAPVDTPADVRLNEVLAAPGGIDWDGDGRADGDDAWLEVANVGTSDLDLRGWLLDDVVGGGAPGYRIPDARVVPARGHRLFFQRETGLALDDAGDRVHLIDPAGRVVDAVALGPSARDVSLARDPDGTGAWTDRLVPSPGQPNGRGGARATAVPAPAPATDTATPGPGATATPALTVTWPVLISEVLFDPAVGGNDAPAEWVELHNRASVPIDLAGWSIGDRGAWDVLPAVAIPARGHVVVAAAAAAVTTTAGAVVAVLSDGRIGGGLGNGGDVVRLRAPTGALADAVSFGDNLDAFDPSVPLVAAGESIERLPGDADTDSAVDWQRQPDPSPGRQGEVHDGPPPVWLNEILPAPAWVDWDGNGAADHTDEWIELASAADYPVRLAGWALADGAAARNGWRFRFDAAATIPPRGFVVVHRAATGLALDNGADRVVLVRPDGTPADEARWTVSPGYDRVWGRFGDATGAWTADLIATPGGPNRRPGAGERHAGDVARAQAAARRGGPRRGRGTAAGAPRRTPPPRPLGLAELRAMRRGTRVVVNGRVTAAPNVLASRTFYLGDPTGGVRVFLNPADRVLKPFVEGDPVSAIGRLSDYRGERQIVLDRPSDAWWDGAGVPVAPAPATTGAVGEALEGRLVGLRGRVVGSARASLTVDDGSGPARIVVLRSTGIALPRWPRGRWVEVTGIVSQSAARAPWEGGYRVLPRTAADLVDRRSPDPATARVARDVGRADRIDAPPADGRPARGPSGRRPVPHE